MRIRMRLTGSGTEDDPWQVPFPRYTMVDVDYDRRRAIIEIPDALAPDDLDSEDTPLRPRINGRPVLIGLRVAQRVKWAAKLRERYPRTMHRIDPDGFD